MSAARMLIEDAPSPRTEQYYECWSNRAYVRDGWLARSLQIRGELIDMNNWTLHNLDLLGSTVSMNDGPSICECSVARSLGAAREPAPPKVPEQGW